MMCRHLYSDCLDLGKDSSTSMLCYAKSLQSCLALCDSRNDDMTLNFISGILNISNVSSFESGIRYLAF